MKADASGTLSEQARAAVGWKSASQIKGRAEHVRRRCKNCAHIDHQTFGSPRCGVMGCVTLVNATCDRFEGSVNAEVRGCPPNEPEKE